MVKNGEYLQKFENTIITKYKLSYKKSLNLFEAMWEEGISFGVLPPSNPMEGIEIDIQIAKILNTCLKN